jgi:hypothetical protein
VDASVGLSPTPSTCYRDGSRLSGFVNETLCQCSSGNTVKCWRPAGSDKNALRPPESNLFDGVLDGVDSVCPFHDLETAHGRQGGSEMSATTRTSSVTSRLPMIAGIAFVVLFVVGFLISGDTPDPNKRLEWRRWYFDSGHRTSAVVGMYLMLLGVLAFVWFLAGLRHRLAERGASETLVTLVFGAGLIFVILAMGGVIARSVVPAGKVFVDQSLPGGDIAQQLEGLGFGTLLIPGALAAGAFVAAASAASRQVDALLAWLTMAGFVVAVLQLIGVLFFPFALFVLWVLVASIVLLARTPSATT